MLRCSRWGLEGHQRGGPLVFALLLLALAACSGRSAPGRAVPGRTEAFARPLEIYGQMGLIAGPANFPLVATVGSMAGPADSSYLLLALSMPNSALRFQREGSAFAAAYTIDVALLRDSVEIARAGASEIVRVGTFAETSRSDESIVFQHAIAVTPGRYVLQLHAADVNSTRSMRAADTIDVPAYGAAATRLSTPLFVYHADGRSGRDERPGIIPNARHSVPYGGESPRLYLEGYGLAAGDTVSVRVLDDAGQSVWSGAATLPRGDSIVRHGVVVVPSASLPLGRMYIEVSAGPAGAAPLRTPLVLTISEQWMIANFEEVLGFLRYIAYPEEIDSLAAATPAERRDRWERFWAIRDPLAVTEVNEYRDAFFERVRYATEAFREPGGRAGWDTDRGEVYIVLGPPMQVLERYIGISEMSFQPNAEEWYYPEAPGGRLSLLFLDRSGLSRYELAPSSESAFRAVADRMRPRRR
ncbi:MAG TPA: GWxTD domain-containing protein [Longimicrobiales bacterium]|nr:GWxTD domain-containing protein [Longimicrobiales bacterium]